MTIICDARLGKTTKYWLTLRGSGEFSPIVDGIFYPGTYVKERPAEPIIGTFWREGDNWVIRLLPTFDADKWLAEHDAALGATVREQCCNTARTWINRWPTDTRLQAEHIYDEIRAIPLPDADRFIERIRLEARLDEAKWWHGDRPEDCTICRLRAPCSGKQRIAELEAALEK